jgi:hypothetical protein
MHGKGARLLGIAAAIGGMMHTAQGLHHGKRPPSDAGQDDTGRGASRLTLVQASSAVRSWSSARTGLTRWRLNNS